MVACLVCIGFFGDYWFYGEVQSTECLLGKSGFLYQLLQLRWDPGRWFVFSFHSFDVSREFQK